MEFLFCQTFVRLFGLAMRDGDNHSDRGKWQQQRLIDNCVNTGEVMGATRMAIVMVMGTAAAGDECGVSGNDSNHGELIAFELFGTSPTLKRVDGYHVLNKVDERIVGMPMGLAAGQGN